METQVIQSNSLESRKNIVNKAVRICVNCGNISVQIQNYGIFCKECGEFFEVRDQKK